MLPLLPAQALANIPVFPSTLLRQQVCIQRRPLPAFHTWSHALSLLAQPPLLPPPPHPSTYCPTERNKMSPLPRPLPCPATTALCYATPPSCTCTNFPRSRMNRGPRRRSSSSCRCRSSSSCGGGCGAGAQGAQLRAAVSSASDSRCVGRQAGGGCCRPGRQGGRQGQGQRKGQGQGGGGICRLPGRAAASATSRHVDRVPANGTRSF
jgi:hypothetical protein